MRSVWRPKINSSGRGKRKGRKDGRKEGKERKGREGKGREGKKRKEGRKEGRKERRKEGGRKEGKKQGKKEGRSALPFPHSSGSGYKPKLTGGNSNRGSQDKARLFCYVAQDLLALADTLRASGLKSSICTCGGSQRTHTGAVKARPVT